MGNSFRCGMLNLRHIKDMIGVRRSGKTTVMYQIIKTLISGGGIRAKNIMLLNFDDPEINSLPLGEVLDAEVLPQQKQ